MRLITKPWTHQQAALTFCKERNASMLHMGMGTGKSRVVVGLVAERQHKRILILCPVSVLNVWSREFARHSEGANVLILNRGTVAEKTEQAKRWVEKEGVRVVVLNYEAAWREPFGEWARSCRPPWDLVVLDESHRAKGPQAKIGKYVDKLRINARQRLCLTGTPLPHSPLDAFSQFRFLDPTIFGRYYTFFRARYAVTNPMFPSQVTRWINQDELAEKIAANAFQVGSEVLDLPPIVHQTRTVELCPRAMKLYRELEEELIADVDAGMVLTAPNALVKLLRLQQITGGAAQVDDGPLIEVDTAKRDALADLLEDLPATEPVVVFCRFRHDLRSVQHVAEQTGRRYGELSGERKDLSDQAEMREDVDLMGVQIASGGVGIDLTRAAYVVFFSLGYSLGEYLQAVARAHRPGQKRHVFVYHLVAAKTVDESVYAALEKRQEVVDVVLNRFRQRKELLNVG